MNNRLRGEVARLFRLAERIQLGERFDEPFIVRPLSRTEALAFRGVGLKLLRQLSRDLSRPPLTGGGYSTEAVQNLLITTCVKAVPDGLDTALDWLGDCLGLPTMEWVVVEPVKLAFKGDVIRLGACTVYREVPPEYADEAFLRHIVPDIKPPVIATVVEAIDEHSARRVADDRIDEALAIAELADGRYRGVQVSKPHLIGERGKPLGANTGYFDLLGLDMVQDDSGQLFPDYQALCQVAATSEPDRLDWERRTLASVRWYARSLATSWPSEALSCSMVALECLFVKSQRERRKGTAIAAAVTERWQIRAGQQAWLNGLYARRNEVVHEGRHFVADVDLYDLMALVRRSVLWAAWHLAGLHRRDGERCVTFDEAMQNHDAL